jgi:hypothetical protein
MVIAGLLCVARPLAAVHIADVQAGEGFRASCPVLACHLRGAAPEPLTPSGKACCVGVVQECRWQDRARKKQVEKWVGMGVWRER